MVFARASPPGHAFPGLAVAALVPAAVACGTPSAATSPKQAAVDAAAEGATDGSGDGGDEAAEAATSDAGRADTGAAAGGSAPAFVVFRATLDPSTSLLTFVGPVNGASDAGTDGSNDGGGVLGAVQLVSSNSCAKSGAGPTLVFACDVELIWPSPDRSLPNPVVRIDDVGVASVDPSRISEYDGANSDGSNPLGLDVAHGLWVYTNHGEADERDPVTGGGPYFLTSAGAGFNTGTRTWLLKDPTGDPVTYGVRVAASLSFSTYIRDFARSSVAYVDACSGGTSADAGEETGIQAPFDFTIFGRTFTGSVSGQGAIVNVGSNGQVTFGPTAPSPARNPIDLPSPAAPAPSVWPFWDDLTYAAGGALCYRTAGLAPHRQLVIEWRGMDFAGPPDQGAALDFEVLLDEGTSEIDTVYRSMVAAPGDTSRRESGSAAYVGLEDETGTRAVGEFQRADYGTGSMYSYVPQP